MSLSTMSPEFKPSKQNASSLQVGCERLLKKRQAVAEEVSDIAQFVTFVGV